MLASNLIKLLEKSISLHGDIEVYVDCTNEALSSSASGVYFDEKKKVIKIGDEDFWEIEQWVKENPDSSYKVVSLERK